MVLLSFPFTLRELSTMSLMWLSAVSAALRALRSPPYFLSEKYFVNVEPERLMFILHPWNEVVSYVKRVRFFFDFIFIWWVSLIDGCGVGC